MEVQDPIVAQPPDKASALYTYLRDNKYAVPEKEDQFRALLADQNKAYALHKFLKAEGKVSVPEEFQDFYSMVNPVKKKESTPVDGAAGPVYPEPSIDLSNLGGTTSAPPPPTTPFDQAQAEQPAIESAINSGIQPDPTKVGDLVKAWNEPQPEPMQFQPQIDLQKQAAEEHRMRVNAGIDEKDRETNPFVTMGKSAWNTMGYQLPSAMVAAGAAMSKPSMDRPSAEAMFPDFSKKQGEQGNRTGEQISKANKASMLEWAAKHGMKGDKLTDDLVSTMDKIHDPIDMLNWVSFALGQASGQIPASVATGGVTSMGQEVGSIYMDGVKKIAQDKGLTIQEVINKDLDKPAFALAYGTAAGLLDYVSGRNLMQGVGKQSLYRTLKARGLHMAEGGAIEAGTEYSQTWMEQIGKGQVAGDSLAKAWEDANTKEASRERLESAAQGGIGGPGTHIMGHVASKALEGLDVKIPKGLLGKLFNKKPADEKVATPQPVPAPTGESVPETPKKEALPVQQKPKAETEEEVVKKEEGKLSDFKKGDIVSRRLNDEEVKTYEIVKADKDIWKLKDMETGHVSDWNANNNIGFTKNQQENAVPIESPEGVLQHPQEGVGEEGGQRPGVEPSVEGTETTPAQQQETVPREVGDDVQEKVVQQISDLIGKEKISKRDIEAIGKEHGLEDKNQIKELTELAIVRKARELSGKDDFEGLVKLYNDQPNLTHRTNESIAKQQYSTPAPIAYLMGKFVNADVEGTHKFEPSAGNGMLTIVGKPNTYTVNEIDPQRLHNLKTQGFKEVLEQNGAEEFGRDKTHDAVITNPPFGGTGTQHISGYKFNELAQIMAVRGLNTMKDNGKAAVIIGGNNKYDEQGRLTGRDRIFFNYLYHHYNVSAVENVSGDLYRKQGASFPIRVVLINGRKATPEGVAPTKDSFDEPIESFEELRDKMSPLFDNIKPPEHENLQPEQLVGGPANPVRGGSPGEHVPTKQPEATALPNNQVSKPSPGRPEGQGTVEGPSPVGSGTTPDTGTESGRPVDSGSNPVERPIPESPVEQGPSIEPESDLPTGTETTSPESRPRSDRKIAEGGQPGESTVRYNPLSKGTNFELMTPAGMKQEVLDAQTDLENDVGDIDDFVQKKLGYKSKEEMYSKLSSEQIDGIALAIRNIERGTGIIIGHQTGVGKGRMAAGIIRYANKQGIQPIFLTEKPNLFTDLYRDLTAIGHGDITPFVVNSKGDKFNGIADDKGAIIHKAPTGTDKVHREMLSSGRIPTNADVILATYSQFSNPRYVNKINFLQKMAQGNIVILDESHNASGEGNTSQLFQQLLPETKGVVYLSGTFAKRADNMPVYALKTSMRETNMTMEDLIGAVEHGGVALQEIISSQLAEAGEMIRLERTFKGIEVNTHITGANDESVKTKQIKQANEVTEVMNEIIDFQKKHILPLIKVMDTEAVKAGVKLGLRQGTNMAGVDSQPYFSKVFNVINQLLYSIKAKDTAKIAIEELKAGRKPFIAIRSTMESMLKDLVDRGDVKVGDALDPDFRFIMKKGLEGVMRYTEKDPQGNEVKRKLDPDELPPAARLEYKYVLSKIGQLKTGLTISPIDEVIQILQDAGYSVGEVTGRGLKLKFKEGKALLEHNKKIPVNEYYRKYNNGELDVLIVNSSGSTGASAHSSKDVKDQRQRSMLILEPELNISTLVQLLGRVNRTGQVNLPKYTFISSHIPAEQRLMMMTMRKLKSLDANTTSNQKQSNAILEVPEIFNKYGDQVVIEYLQENPEIIEQIGNPLKSNEDGTEPQVTHGAANKVTGRVAILHTDKQAAFYADMIDRYAKYMQFLNEAGMNDLSIASLPLRAKTLSKKVTIAGKGGRSKFGEDTYLEQVEADVLKKPMTHEEIQKTIADLTPPAEVNYIAQLREYQEKVTADLRADEDARLAKRLDKINAEKDSTPQEKEQQIRETTELSELSFQNKVDKEATTARFIESLFKFFTPGRAVQVPFDLNDTITNMAMSNGIFMGFDINLAKAKPFIRSNIILKFAVNDSRRLLSIPASKANVINNIRSNSYDMGPSRQKAVSEGWDTLPKPHARGKRFVVTGNILQGLSNPEYKGQIVKYSTEAGHINTGILLNESFDPQEAGVSGKISVPAVKAIEPMLKAAPGTEFNSTDKLWTITKRSGEKYSLRVPKSKATGGKYFLDGAIANLVDNGRWDSVGDKMEAFTDGTRLEELMHLLTDKFNVAFTISMVDFSKRSGGTFENPGAMATIIPLPPSKRKKNPTNKKLLEHLNAKNKTEAELEDQLNEEIKFRPEVEARVQAAGEPTKPNMTTSVLDHVKNFLSGFTSHFKYLSEKAFPREANILREFEGLKPFTNKQAEIYIKGLTEPLTVQQYKVMSRRIWLEDMLGSIDRGLEMTGLDGKLPFGFENRDEVAKELKKFKTLTEADPALETAYEKRNDFMQMFKDMLINAGLLSENDIDSYYHRRVLAYQQDSEGKSILFGKDIADKRRGFQHKRTGTKGMDYSTNFIETEFKVVAEGLYELEKQRILKDLMRPYEAQLNTIKKTFNREFEARQEEIEDQFGKNSVEAEIYKGSKSALMRNYLQENLPDGYTFYRVSDENRLFWARTVTQQALDKSLELAKQKDSTGTMGAVDTVDFLIGELNTGLMVGAKRKAYMIPTQLANQLTEMAKNTEINPAEGMIRGVTNEWKKIMLMAPNRLLKYNINNFGSDLDRTLQVEPAIMKYSKEAWNELWNFHQTGEVTAQLLEAQRGSVIDSGFEISELNSLSKQQWSSYFLDRKEGPSIEDIFGKKWTKDMMGTVASSPKELYNKYIDWAAKYTRLRENMLRYAAYKLAAEKINKGETFYWASNKNAVDVITDPRQKTAKLAREVYGDYGNISYSGQWLRRHLIPFYSWQEINMGTHIQLIKNASSPEVQKAMLQSAVARGIPRVAAKMAIAWAKIFLFTAMIEAWNHFRFPDDDDEAEKMRRTGHKGMQILLYKDDEGKVHGIPVIGAFYDFMDFLGIPGAVDDVAHIFTGNDPMQSVKKLGKNELYNVGGKVFQMATPAIKMPLEAATGQTYFPDPKNPIPIKDYGEWFAEALTLKDEYNYTLTDKPQRQSYLDRKLTNSLVVREFDPEMLAYYQAKRIISNYTGERADLESKNPQEVAKKKAIDYFTLALRYGKKEEADKFIQQYFENGGTLKALKARFRYQGNVLAGLKTKPNIGESVSEQMDLRSAMEDKDYKPKTKFVQGLTGDEILVFKDAEQYNKRQNLIK